MKVITTREFRDNQRNNRIYLIGYMGSGKTTVGKELAQKLNYQFIDTDHFIENRYRKSIKEIFAEKGEEVFRVMENRVLKEISSFENVVVSTGGGIPCFFDNMEIMNRTGFTIYLKVSVQELSNRLNVGKQNRPLLKDKTIEEMHLFVDSALQQREPFYSQAKLIFDAEKMLDQTDVISIVEKLETLIP